MENFTLQMLSAGRSEQKGAEELQPVSMMKLVRLTMTEWRSMLLALMFQFVSIACAAISPMCIGLATDAAVQQSSEGLTRAMLLLLGTAACGVAANFITEVIAGIAGIRITCRIRRDLYEALLRQDFAFHASHDSAELVSTLIVDVNSFGLGICLCWLKLLGAVLRLAVYFCMLMSTAWMLGCTALATLFVMSLVIGRMLPWVSKSMQVLMGRLGESCTVAKESIEAIQAVRYYGAEVLEFSRYGAKVGNGDRKGWCGWWPRRSNSYYHASVMVKVTFTAVCAVMMAFINWTLTNVVWIGLKLVLEGQISIGQVVQAHLLLCLLITAFAAVCGTFGMVAAACGAGAKVFDILAQVPEISTMQGGANPESAEGDVCFEDVEFAYPNAPEQLVLKGLSLTLPAGSSTAVIGYRTVCGARGMQLSVSQKQRLAFARAMFTEPKVLLLDEVTSNLDQESERMIVQAVASLAGKCTVLAVAHRLHTVQDFDQIAVVSEGRVHDVGSHDELLGRCEMYIELAQRQNTPVRGISEVSAQPRASLRATPEE